MLSLSHQVFYEVANQLSFSKAAKVLFISQPAISRHIKMLEENYSQALFERNGSSIHLTPMGKKIYEYLREAREIQRKIEYEVSIAKAQSEAEGNLKLGASTTVSLYIIPKILSQFHKTVPKINIQVVNRNTENITHALLNKQIDVAIVEVEKKLNNVQYDYFTSDKIIAVCVPLSVIATKSVLTMADLLRLPVALRESGSGTLSALERELAKQGVSISQLDTKVRLGGTEALKNFLLADHCVGFLPQKAVEKELQRGELVEIAFENLDITRDFFFLTRKGEDFSLTKQFIRFSKKAV